MNARTNPAINPDHRRTARNAAVNMSMLGIESGGVMIVSDHPDAVPRVTVNLAALVELVKRAKTNRVIFSGDENGARTEPDHWRECEYCHRGREVEYTTAAAAWLCVNCRDEFNIRTPEQSELRLVVGDKFHTVTDGGSQDVWTYAGCRDGEYLIVQEIDGQEYTRVVELVGDTWRCVDDPDEFTGIIHVPTDQENK